MPVVSGSIPRIAKADHIVGNIPERSAIQPWEKQSYIALRGISRDNKLVFFFKF
jgi:hypothetical protein